MKRTITRTIEVPEARMDELRQDVRHILSPSSLGFNDGWAAKAFLEKWSFSVNDAQQLTGRFVVREGFEK